MGFLTLEIMMKFNKLKIEKNMKNNFCIVNVLLVIWLIASKQTSKYYEK